NYRSRTREAEEAKELIEREGRRCILVPVDVSEPADVERIVRQTREHLGPIGLLVANAAISILESHQQISWDTWKKTMAVNLDGPFLCLMAVKDEMLAAGYGRIVCISSVAAPRPRKMQIHYASSKAGLLGLVRCFAEALAPGLIETEMGESIGPATTQAIIDATPLGRLGKPEEIANVTYFLLSDQASFMTGQTVAVSGGRVMLP